MKPLRERLNELLDQHKASSGSHWQYLDDRLRLEHELDLEIADLIALAWKLRTAPQLRASPRFAQHMEQQLLRYSSSRHSHQSSRGQISLLKHWLIFIYKHRHRE